MANFVPNSIGENHKVKTRRDSLLDNINQQDVNWKSGLEIGSVGRRLLNTHDSH